MSTHSDVFLKLEEMKPGDSYFLSTVELESMPEGDKSYLGLYCYRNQIKSCNEFIEGGERSGMVLIKEPDRQEVE